MDLKQWKSNHGTHRLEILARRVGTTRNYLVQIAFGHRQPSPRLAKLIEKFTEGEVSRYDLRPDVYDLEDEMELENIAKLKQQKS